MDHDTIFQWQQYAQSLEMDLQRTKKEQVKIEEAHSQLDLKYEELKWIYWQVKRKYEKCKTKLNYGIEVGDSVCAEYLYYTQSYTELLEHYRQLWSACYATPAASGQEQERSDHGNAQKSTAVLPLNLTSRKMRSSPSTWEVPPLAFTYIMSFKEDNVTNPGLRSKPGQAAGSVMIHLFPNQSVLYSLGLKRKAVGALRSPPEAASLVDVKQENSFPILPYATLSVRFSKDKLEELELPQFQDKSSSIFPKSAFFSWPRQRRAQSGRSPSISRKITWPDQSQARGFRTSSIQYCSIGAHSAVKNTKTSAQTEILSASHTVRTQKRLS